MTILVSTFGDDGRGGVFALNDARVTQLDDIETTGLAFAEDRLARLVRAPAELTSTAELIVYDDRGVLEYQRLDAIRDPHDVLADGGDWLVVSTGTNEIVRVAPTRMHTVWHGPDAPDACHVNCITRRGAELWASAFGWFDTFKGWRGPNAKGAGVLFNVQTNEQIGALSHPHTPRWVDGAWLVCESLLGTLVERAPDGTVTRQCELGGYTRGIAMLDDRLLVGVSAKRDTTDDAFVAIVDRASFACIDRVLVPASEIYDIVLVPPNIAQGVGVGFATNPHRAAISLPAPAVFEQPAIDRANYASRVDTILPTRARAGDALLLDVTVENTGTATLASVRPQPIFVASRWIAEHGDSFDGDRMPLPVVLRRGARTALTLPVVVPAQPGRYWLTISLVREGQFWFDELDAAFAATATVDVS